MDYVVCENQKGNPKKAVVVCRKCEFQERCEPYREYQTKSETVSGLEGSPPAGNQAHQGGNRTPAPTPLKETSVVETMGSPVIESEGNAQINFAKGERPQFTPPSSEADALEKIGDLWANMSEHAYVIGKTLIWVKDKVAHGQFEQWVKHNLWFTPRTGRNLMQFAHKCDSQNKLLDYHPRKKQGNAEKREIQRTALVGFTRFVEKHFDEILNDVRKAIRYEQIQFDRLIRGIFERWQKTKAELECGEKGS